MILDCMNPGSDISKLLFVKKFFKCFIILLPMIMYFKLSSNNKNPLKCYNRDINY